MTADKIHVDTQLAGRLVAAQFPRWAGLPVEPVDSAGTDNTLYRLGDHLLLRLPRLQRPVAQVAKEQRWLPRLAPLLPLPIPVPLAQGLPGAGHPWPWSIYPWLDGPGVHNTPDRSARHGNQARGVRGGPAADRHPRWPGSWIAQLLPWRATHPAGRPHPRRHRLPGSGHRRPRRDLGMGDSAAVTGLARPAPARPRGSTATYTPRTC